MFYSEKFLRHHAGPGHPERPERLETIVGRIRSDEKLSGKLQWPTFAPATIKDLERVHCPDYIQLVKKKVGGVPEGKTANLSTGDTVISPDSWNAAILAAGAGIAACKAVMAGHASSAFALVRPPGHHATRDRGMGFCIFNNTAVAARYLQECHDIRRVLIVDIDAHHGNGTQDIFYDDNSVFFFCIHQHPFYPGSGRPLETGAGRGKGYTLNVDLPVGSGDEAVRSAFRNQLLPAMELFKPEFVLVSAGFDGHVEDPLGELACTSTGYAEMARDLLEIARLYAGGKIVFMLEGGYAPTGMAESVAGILAVLQEIEKKEENK